MPCSTPCFRLRAARRLSVRVVREAAGQAPSPAGPRLQAPPAGTSRRHRTGEAQRDLLVPRPGWQPDHQGLSDPEGQQRDYLVAALGAYRASQRTTTPTRW